MDVYVDVEGADYQASETSLSRRWLHASYAVLMVNEEDDDGFTSRHSGSFSADRLSTVGYAHAEALLRR